jgi:type I restriction enzyme S subunit
MDAETSFTQLANAPCGIQRLRETILRLAVQGKLVPQEPNDEPAVDLLTRINAERKGLVSQNKVKEPKLLPRVDEDVLGGILPSGWTLARLGDLALSIEAGWSPQCGEQPRSGHESGRTHFSLPNY